MLTPLNAITYPYNPRVDDFADRLSALIELSGSKPGELARRAYPDDDAEQLRIDFVNYLSRIARKKVPSPGIKWLTRIADGFGLPLSQFFLQLERQTDPDGVLVPASNIVTPSLQPQGGANGEPTSVSSADDLEILRRAYYEIGKRNIDLARRLDAVIGKATKARVARSKRAPRPRRSRG